MRLARFLFVSAALTLAVACLPRKKSPQRNTPPTDDRGLGDLGGPQDLGSLGGKPAKLLAEEEAVYAQAGACLVVNVNVMDAEEFYVSTEKDTTVNLSSSPSNLPFFSDPACSVGVKSFSIPKGASGGGVFLSAPLSGSTKISFNDAAQGELAPTSTIVNAATVTQLGSRGAGIPVALNECAPQSIVAQDAEGHPVVLAKESTITVSSSSTTGKFFTDDECTKEGNSIKLGAGESESESIYYKDSSAGAPSLTFSDPSNATWKKATIAITVLKNTD